MEKLDAVPWEIVNDTKKDIKSIAVLIQYMINWRIIVLIKWMGNVAYDVKIDGPNDWSSVYINGKKEWDELTMRLQQTHKDFLEILSDATEELLKKKCLARSILL
ncbi:hypothetical protein SAMN05421636_102466 [Pricia antarctica]|uniref:Uncharacterized protein n=1 Tax=Pricia antarctica TaxID=641691 RepID=A0A1G6Z4S6_9FLAO|nr:hypothetical protein [Pricia antarctica]SDD96845.1 hypothetical protein SAMN05421636_102466 [Pricia antarctica]